MSKRRPADRRLFFVPETAKEVPEYKRPSDRDHLMVDAIGMVHVVSYCRYKGNAFQEAMTQCGLSLAFPMRPRKNKRTATCLVCLGAS